MSNINIILTNPTVNAPGAPSQFTAPFNLATTQEKLIALNTPGFANITLSANSSQFANPFNALTTQEQLIATDTPGYQNPTETAGTQFGAPYDIATTQEQLIATDTPGFRNPTEFAPWIQFTANWSAITTQQEALISNPTQPHTTQFLPPNAGNNIGAAGQFQPASGFADAPVQNNNPTLNNQGGTAIDPSQPFNNATTQEELIAIKAAGYRNPTVPPTSSWENPATMPGVVDTFVGQNTNITPNSLLAQGANIGANIGGSLLGIPQVTQIGNTLINQLDGIQPAPYLTTAKSRLKPFIGVKYPDFRSRFTFPGRNLRTQREADKLSDDATDEEKNNFFNTPNQAAAYLSSRRLDGTGAGIRSGSPKAYAYAAASLTPPGPYSVFNLDGFGKTGYGWGDHDNPYALRNDFTARSHVATVWKLAPDVQDTFAGTQGTAKMKYQWVSTGLPNEKITPFRGDKVNVIDFGQRDLKEAYLWKPFRNPENNKNDRIHGLKLTQDFIKFYFTGPKLFNGAPTTTIDDIIVFRALLTGLSDSFTAQWNPVNMIGRADPNYHYTGFTRDVSVGFDIYATDRDEVKPIYRKLNALAGYTAPTYNAKSIAMQAPWMRITIGDLFVQQPVTLTSLSYTFATDAPWEINIEDDSTMMQVPLKIGVQCSFNMITDYLPKQKGTFYTLAKEFQNGLPKAGNNNWLSDFDAGPLDETIRIRQTVNTGEAISKTNEDLTLNSLPKNDSNLNLENRQINDIYEGFG